MRLFFIIILLLTVSVFGVIFTVFNAEQVPVNLYFVQYSLPMATVVFVAIFIGVLSFNLFGDGLRDALDPRFKI